MSTTILLLHFKFVSETFSTNQPQEVTMKKTGIGLAAAVEHITAQLQKMREAAGNHVIFDEFAIVRFIGGKLRIEHYSGPRTLEEYRAGFTSDITPLRQDLLEARQEELGYFHFDQEAEGSAYDAFIKIGPETFLLLNNIELSMLQLRDSKNWLDAQEHFLRLTSIFGRNPLTSFD